jgi:drug/metabolite transporter (DMT)-like permease
VTIVAIYHRERSKVSLRGVVLATSAVILWSTIGVSFKLTVPNLGGFATTVFTNLLASFALGINLIVKGKLLILRKEWNQRSLFFFVTGIVGLGIQQLFYFKGCELLPASQMVTLFYLYPLLMSVFSALLFRQPLTSKSILLLIAGCIGVYFMVFRGELLTIQLNFGVIVTLLAAAGWALFSVLIQYKNFDPEVGMFLFTGFGFLFLLGLAPVFGLPWRLTPTEWLGIFYLALVPTAIGCLLWNQALRLSSTTTCSALALLTPLFSVLLSVVILKESLLSTQLIGALVIFGAVILNLRLQLANRHRNHLSLTNDNP